MERKNEKNINLIVGVDEVGRGPIAGPVCVCAFSLKEDEYESFVKEAKEFLGLPLRDSKKLTKKYREKWFSYLKKQKEKGVCDYQMTFVSNEMIDKFGIAKCIQKAIDESLRKVTQPEILFERSSPACNDVATSGRDEGGKRARPFQKESPASFHILLDGGLKARDEFKNQKSYIKGDELYPIISFASIMAKVSRDRIMENYAKEYGGYGFDKNMGYGTKTHYEAIKKYGMTKIHRKSFIH